MKVIRRGVFETNSSSTHSITMCSKEDYDKWKHGNLFIDTWGNKFVKSPEEAEYSRDAQTYEQYFDDDELESFEDTYTTKSEEVIVAFGKYGRDD